MLAGRCAAFILAAAFSALPAFGEPRTEPNQCTDDVMLVFDASGSMASVGYNEMAIPRIAEAIEAVRRVLPKVTDYRRIGLIVYGPGTKDTCSNIDLKVLPDYRTAPRILSQLDAVTPDGDTPLTASVEIAAESLHYRERPAVVVIVTDGDETCGGDPCGLARKLQEEGVAITVHVIGFKVRSKFFSWQSQADPSDAPDMAARCLADVTNGQFITAETTEELVKALQRTLGCPAITDAARNKLAMCYAPASACR